MIAEDQVIKDLWNDLGIPGASRVYRKSNLRRDTECGVHRLRRNIFGASQWETYFAQQE
jgi:hypothetical protein